MSSHIRARLEMVKNEKIVYGKNMYGYDVEIGDLVKYFFDNMPEWVDKKANLRIRDVEKY